MTYITDICEKYCKVYVDDIRLTELAATNPALYAAKMAAYFVPGIALFTLPVDVQEYLYGTAANPRFVEPQYDARAYVTTETTSTITFDSGCTGYELVSCELMSIDAAGKYYTTPVEVSSYNATTGTVVLTLASPAPAGTEYRFYFYKDGYFVADLTAEEQKILAMCFQLVWRERFNEDWLSNVSKVEDKSFTEQNRANKERADTERLNAIRDKLASAMRRYEQNRYYKAKMPQGTPSVY